MANLRPQLIRLGRTYLALPANREQQRHDQPRRGATLG
jgi:hypothetical protein